MQLRGWLTGILVVCIVAFAPAVLLASESRSGANPEEGAEGDGEQKEDDSETKGGDWEMSCSYTVDPGEENDPPGGTGYMDNHRVCMDTPTPPGGGDPVGLDVHTERVSSFPLLDIWKITLADEVTEPDWLCRYEWSDNIRYNALLIEGNDDLVAKVRKFNEGFSADFLPVGGQFTIYVNDVELISVYSLPSDTPSTLNARVSAALFSSNASYTDSGDYWVFHSVGSKPSVPVFGIAVFMTDLGVIEAEVALEPDTEAGSDTTPCSPGSSV